MNTKTYSLPVEGISSIIVTNSTSNASGSKLILGDNSSGKIYSLEEKSLSLVYQSGDQSSVKNLIKLADDGTCLASIGGKLNIIFSNTFVDEMNRTYANVSSSNSVSVGNSMTILDLGEETITDMIEIEDTNNIVFATSNGRIISCSRTAINAYLTGNVTVYADVRNGFGLSNSASTDFMYALYKTIAEVNESKEIEKWKFVSNASAILNQEVIGEFVAPIIHVKEDLGFWKQLYWTETKPDDTDIIISIRTGETSEGLLVSPWALAYTSTAGEANPITRSLNNVTLKGQYLQLKVRMVTSSNNVTPIVSNVTIQYSTKQASYFFTTKFSFDKNSEPNNGLLVADITEPQNTEVKIGVTSTNSSDWADYQVVDPDRLFTLTDQNMQNIKVGIKFVSYDTEVAEVAEFALFIGGEKVKILST